MKISMRNVICLLTVALGSAGCGGGSGLTGGGSKSYPISTTLRSLQPGDNWSWAYSEATSATNGGVPVGTTATSTGIESSTISSAVLNGQSYLVQTIDSSNYPPSFYGGTGFTSAPAYDYTQDPSSKSLYRTGMYGSLLAAPVLYLPGTWYAGYSSSASSAFSYGTTYAVTFTVVGQERVTVPAGTFMTWKTSVVETTTTGSAPTLSTSIVTGTYWYAPQIGNFVKASTQAESPNDPSAGATLTVTFNYQLSSTNTL